MNGSYLWIVKLFVVLAYVGYSDAHGRLLEPVARSTAWRSDSRFPVYYDDNQMFCGGFQVQWGSNGGKCSICGENYTVTHRLFDRGGNMYTGIIVKSYNQGQTINAHVEITANHLGWFEFRICNVDGWTTEATQDCLDQTLLKDAFGNSRFSIASTVFDFQVQLVLPSTLTCNHCVFQWKYNTGNSWGVDPITGVGCVGCGSQEQFYGCSDISIGASSQPIQSSIISTISTASTISTSSTIAPSSTTDNAATSPSCPNGDGYYADVSSGCKKFNICSNTGTPNAMVNTLDCPVGLLFDNILKVCNWPSLVICQ